MPKPSREEVLAKSAATHGTDACVAGYTTRLIRTCRRTGRIFEGKDVTILQLPEQQVNVRKADQGEGEGEGEVDVGKLQSDEGKCQRLTRQHIGWAKSNNAEKKETFFCFLRQEDNGALYEAFNKTCELIFLKRRKNINMEKLEKWQRHCQEISRIQVKEQRASR